MQMEADISSPGTFEDDYRKAYSPDLAIEPLVSIVCVAYNHVSFIRDALDGFLMQETSFPYEIIVHDDASNDGTIAVIEEYARQHPDKFVLILRNTNIHSRGQSATYHALKHVRGKYVALCEGDDFWTDTTKIQKQVDFLQANPDYAVCYHQFYPCTKKEQIGFPLPQHLKQPIATENGQKRKPNYMTTATVMFRYHPEFLPPDIHQAKFRDNFIFAMLGNYGKGMYLDDIKPSGYRLTSGGIFSLTSETQKILDRIITFFWIANAFESHYTDKSAAWFWRYRAAKILATASGSSKDEIKTGLCIAWYGLKALLRRSFKPFTFFFLSLWSRVSRKARPKAIVFGASRGGRNAYLNLHHKYDIIAFTDNDSKKHGSHMFDKKVIAPDDITAYPFDIILISSTFRWQIVEQLQTQYNIEPNKIMVVPPNMVVA